MSTIDTNKSYVIQGQTLQDICNAVKNKTGASTVNVSDLATEIENIPTGGGGGAEVVFDGSMQITQSTNLYNYMGDQSDVYVVLISNVYVNSVEMDRLDSYVMSYTFDDTNPFYTHVEDINEDYSYNLMITIFDYYQECFIKPVGNSNTLSCTVNKIVRIST